MLGWVICLDRNWKKINKIVYVIKLFAVFEIYEMHIVSEGK